MPPSHFRSAILSNWQSVVATKVRRPDPLAASGVRPALDFAEARISAAARAAFDMEGARPETVAELPVQRGIEPFASAALSLGMALLSKDPLKVIEAKAGFMASATTIPSGSNASRSSSSTTA